jgi:hypothetical protein
MGSPMSTSQKSEQFHDLKWLIEFASTQAEKLFRKQGIIYPLYHCIRANGESTILTPPPGDKDRSVALVKAWLSIENISTVCFMDEAWILDDRRGQLGLDMEKIRREGIRNHPDRREVVMFSAENRRGEALTARRFILRPEIGKATLAPLVIDEPYDHSEGRMVGLLQRDKR